MVKLWLGWETVVQLELVCALLQLKLEDTGMGMCGAYGWNLFHLSKQQKERGERERERADLG